MTRITVRITVDHGNEGASLAESTTVAEGDSARAALRLLLAGVMKRSDLVLPPEQGITTDADEISEFINGEPVADASADEGESLSDRVNRILPELEDLVARLRTPRPKAEPCSARGAAGKCPAPSKGGAMPEHQCDQFARDFRVTFPGPFSHHDVVVNGWSVPFVKASFRPDDENHVRLILDDRMALDLTADEAERLTPFLADAIAVALGYGAHPREGMESLSEHAPHAAPRRVVRVAPDGGSP